MRQLEPRTAESQANVGGNPKSSPRPSLQKDPSLSWVEGGKQGGAPGTAKLRTPPPPNPHTNPAHFAGDVWPSYLRQEVEPGVVKDGWWDAGVGVGDLLDLVGQAQHHLRQELGVGLKHVRCMALRGREGLRLAPNQATVHPCPAWSPLLALVFQICPLPSVASTTDGALLALVARIPGGRHWGPAK